MSKWIPIKIRECTKEESEQGYTFMFDCEMPDIGERVLICGENWIELDEIVEVETVEGVGLGLDSGQDWEDVKAWMPLPEPYKE